MGLLQNCFHVQESTTILFSCPVVYCNTIVMFWLPGTWIFCDALLCVDWQELELVRVLCYALTARNLGRRPLGVQSPTIRRREGPSRAWLQPVRGVFGLSCGISFEDAGCGLTLPQKGPHTDFTDSTDFGRHPPPDYTEAIRAHPAPGVFVST
jgi:hypothetical protein